MISKALGQWCSETVWILRILSNGGGAVGSSGKQISVEFWSVGQCRSGQ
jgi:hypothetical protein